MHIARWLHILGVVVWVGGMFFAHMALRPSAQALPPPQRLPLLAATLARFVGWAGVAIAAILGSGAVMIVMMGGFAAVNASVHAMTGLGVLMMLIYGHLALGPLPRLRAAVAEGVWERAGAAMTQVRRLVAVNLVLGLVTLTIAVLGRG
ncbi:MAG: CopD family protein [Burkholderiales bacterium]|nr:CopD family protein [Burkholderiales bacterium]